MHYGLSLFYTYQPISIVSEDTYHIKALTLSEDVCRFILEKRSDKYESSDYIDFFL